MNTNIKDRTKAVELSIVTTMYSSEDFVAEFHRRSTEAVTGITLSYEIIFVNDGSPDKSLDKVRNIVDIDEHVCIVDLSRNFGHHRAIMVGLEYSHGRKVFLIDCDLEEDPLSLPDFFAEMIRTHADVVYGIQNTRNGSFVRRLGGAWFWKFFNFISDVEVNPKVITSRLMTRRYVDSLLNFREQELFLAGIFSLTGFEQIPLTVKKEARLGTSYTIRKRFSLLVNAITSFSSRPLIFVFYLGLVISLISGVAAAVLFARKIFFGDFLLGWSSVVVSIWLMGGISIFCIGLIGIYLSKVFSEVKERPLSIIRNIYEYQPKENFENENK